MPLIPTPDSEGRPEQETTLQEAWSDAARAAAAAARKTKGSKIRSYPGPYGMDENMGWSKNRDIRAELRKSGADWRHAARTTYRKAIANQLDVLAAKIERTPRGKRLVSLIAKRTKLERAFGKVSGKLRGV